MNLQERITEYLRDHPVSKAREVASALVAERGDINRILYAGQGRLFGVDNDFRWRVIDAAQSQVLTSAQESAPTPLDGNGRNASWEIRATLARLKRGVPPDRAVESLAIGMDHLVDRLSGLLDAQATPRWFAVTGEYGEGKSFFRVLACERALAAGYAVASFDVNRDDGALHQPQRHLAVLLNTLRSPLPAFRDHQGVVDLFRQWIAVTTPPEVMNTLTRLQLVDPPINNVRDAGDISFLIDRVVSSSNGSGIDLNNNQVLLRLVTLLSSVDLIGRSSYARFSAAYRLQVIVDWLLATGHKGLLLFIDEVDNVARQIHGKAHPACFRTLAWYCSAQQLKSLRVIFAMTPEMVERIGDGYRTFYGNSLKGQETVHRDECEVYEQWSNEAGRLSVHGWDECPSLRPSQRLELFRRIASLHREAWETSSTLTDDTVRTLTNTPAFGTTRRWVRACVQVLDLMQQHRLDLS